MSRFFKDFFSSQAAVYAQSRPDYPPALFQYLSSLCKEREIAWDCATGNGQAAIGLAPYFEKVLATDASDAQIQHCFKHEKVRYSVEAAENNSIANQSINLITVAQAAHWFHLQAFYKRVEAVLKPSGVLALWSYSEPLLHPQIDALLEWFMYGYLADYWPNDRLLVRKKYRTIEFPYKQIGTPNFYCVKNWTLRQFLQYALSWSATNRFIQQHQVNPVEEVLFPKILPLWGNIEKTIEIRWQLHLKVSFV